MMSLETIIFGLLVALLTYIDVLLVALQPFLMPTSDAFRGIASFSVGYLPISAA